MRIRWILPAVILLSALLLGVYAQGSRFAFVDLDDDAYVTANPMVLSGLTREGFLRSLQTFRASNWHPLTWWPHMADVEWFGLVQVGGQAMGDRYTYIPLVGLFLMAAWGSWDLVSGTVRGRTAYAAAWGAIVLCLSAASHVQAGTGGTA